MYKLICVYISSLLFVSKYYTTVIETIVLSTQSLILHQMLTFEDILNLRKVKTEGFVTVTPHQF